MEEKTMAEISAMKRKITGIYISPDDSQKAVSSNAYILSRRDFVYGGAEADQITGCKANQLIAKIDTPWVYFAYLASGKGIETDLLQIGLLASEHEDADFMITDEALGDALFLYQGDHSNLVAGNEAHTIPSRLLIRKEALDQVCEGSSTFGWFPIYTMIRRALKSGFTGRTVHRLFPAPISGGADLIVPNLSELKNGRRLLVITHELDLTGAPLVLAEACINILKPAGYQILMVSPFDGPVKDMLIKNGIPVMVRPAILQMTDDYLLRLALSFDAVMVNTAASYAPIRILEKMTIPVLWWIHECRAIYPHIKDRMPSELPGNIRVFCAGPYAKRALLDYFPAYRAEVLLYSIQDHNPEGNRWPHIPGHLMEFAIVGTIEERKGQDIFANAIQLLDDAVRKKCHFLFIGKINHPAIFQAVSNIANQFPEQVTYKGVIPRDELDEIYKATDFVVCASRDDPMPVFVAEGMMFSKPIICSENTGSAPLIEAYGNGCVYRGDSPEELAACITRMAALDASKREILETRSRKCFEENFAMDVCKRNALQAVKETFGSFA